MRIPKSSAEAGLFLGSDLLDEDVVGEAVAPFFVRLERFHGGMAVPFGVFTSVAIRRLIAAPDLSASEAHAEVEPCRSDREAFLTSVRSARGRNLGDL